VGEETIVVASGGTSGGTTRQQGDQGNRSTSYSENWSENWQQHGRKLLKPEEVMGLPARIAITFTPGVPPIWSRLVRYYESDFGERARGFLLAVKALGQSIVMLIAAGLLALALAQLGSDRRLDVPGVPAQHEDWLFR